jgi:hypothetical protein
MSEVVVGLSAIFGAIVGSIAGPIISNWYEDKRKLRAVERHETHVRYSDMIGNIPSFFAGARDPEGIKKFTDAYRRAWLYVSDEVIESINGFLISAGGVQGQETKADKDLRNMIWTMRKDFKKDTKLKREQFLIVSP